MGEGMGGTSEEPWGVEEAAAVVVGAAAGVDLVVVLVASLETEDAGTTWSMGASTTTKDTVSHPCKECVSIICMYKSQEDSLLNLPTFHTCIHIFLKNF